MIDMASTIFRISAYVSKASGRLVHRWLAQSWTLGIRFTGNAMPECFFIGHIFQGLRNVIR